MHNETHTETAVGALKKGEYVRFKPNGPVWINDGKVRGVKRHTFTKFDDVNKETTKADATVCYVGFTF